MPKNDLYYIEVLGKALVVLDAFVKLDKPRLSLQEITQQSELSKNTVFRILFTLGEHGFVVKHNTEYELGGKVLELANTRMRRKDLSSVAGPFMDRLRDEFDETVNLGILDGVEIRYIDVRESHARFRLAERVGGSDYLHCTALGKAHLAYMPEERVQQLLKDGGMPRLTDRSITTASAMKGELARVRKLGCAVDREESMLGAYCVAAPILDSNGTPLAAISVSGPTVRFNENNLAAACMALLAASSEIRTQLGHA